MSVAMACFKNSIQNKAQIDSDFFLPLENSKYTALMTLKSDTLPIQSTSI